MGDLTDRLRCFDRQTCTEAAERIETLEAELAAMRAGGEPVAEMVPYHTPSGKRVAVISRFQHLPIGTKLYTHPQPAAQDAERIQALELEVRQLTEKVAELRDGGAYSLPEWLEVMHASEIRGIWNDCKRDGLHYVAFAWRIERLGWQRLLDALRSSRGKAPAQQPAPSAAPAVVSEREFKQFLSDVMTAAGLVTHGKQCKDLGSRLGAMCVRLRSPTPQADSQPAPANTRQIAECYGDCPEDPKTCANPCKFEGRAARAQADSVLEDAARLERERICAAIKAEDDYCVEHGDYMLDSDDCIKIVRAKWVRPDYSVDAARKQGANHD